MKYTHTFILILELFHSINRVYSNHITLWKRKEKYDDKIFANQPNLTVQPLPAVSAISCGRLCTGLRNASAFSYLDNDCYCYDSKPTDTHSLATLRGAEFYSKEPIAKYVECADKMYTYLGAVNLCFKVHNKDLKNFTEAAAKCQSDGAHLIMTDTYEKIEVFMKVLNINNFYWTGLEMKEGSWEWTKTDQWNLIEACGFLENLTVVNNYVVLFYTATSMVF